MDLDELDREGHEWDHGQLLRAARSLGAELRTLRARVGELEAENARRKEHERAAILEMAKARNEKMDAQMRGDLNAWLVHDFEEERGEGLVKKLWDKAKGQHKRITDLESQIAAAREEQGLEAKVREALGDRFGLLNLFRLFSGHWRAEWGYERRAHGDTLPALLRAILDTEEKPR